MARRKRKQWKPIDTEQMSERQREGFVQGEDPREVWEEAKDRTPAPGIDGLTLVRHMRDVEKVVGSRVPLPKFVGSVPDETSLVTTFADGRSFQEVNLTYQPETIRAFRAGMICFKCLEPQAYAFEDHHMPDCEGLALRGPRYMRDRQIMDIAMEMDERGVHLGPAKPIAEHFEQMELVAEQRRFRRRIEEGRSLGRGARRA